MPARDEPVRTQGKDDDENQRGRGLALAGERPSVSRRGNSTGQTAEPVKVVARRLPDRSELVPTPIQRFVGLHFHPVLCQRFRLLYVPAAPRL